MSALRIHIISTVNGQVNEGMRNIATHISHALEKDNEVCYSGLKSFGSIIKNSKTSEVTMIFARANQLVYWLSRFVSVLNKNLWIVCVQKPDKLFTDLVRMHPLKANYLMLVEKDLKDIVLQPGYKKELFSVGIKTDKFIPVDREKQFELKAKYGFSNERPLVIHVGHCSAGRGLEDFSAITESNRMVVASGMFEDNDTVMLLENSGVKIHKGYLEQVEEIYQMADVYLFPTHSTEYVISIPLSVMEALSCGVPVIGYKDFENLKEIPAKDGAVTLINGKDELNATVFKLLNKKQNHSYLISPKTWEQVANEVLSIVRRSY